MNIESNETCGSERGFTPRLCRLERLFVDHPIYFVTMCVQGRRPVLNDSTVHRAVEPFGARGLTRGFYLGRYVLMPDHLHAFVAFGIRDVATKLALSAWVKALKGCVSKTWRERELNDVRWQKGFFDHVLRSCESYSSKWQYVAQNPVRAGLAEESEDWLYQGEVCRLEMPSSL